MNELNGLVWDLPRPSLFLVDDDTISVNVGTKGVSDFRVRVWRGNRKTPVVLVSQTPGGAPPSWATKKIATRVMPIFLGYCTKFSYHESHTRDAEQVLVRHKLEFSGNPNRPMVCHATGKTIGWDEFNFLVGHEANKS